MDRREPSCDGARIMAGARGGTGVALLPRMTISRIALLVSPLALVASLTIACGASPDDNAAGPIGANAPPTPSPPPPSSSASAEQGQDGEETEGETHDAGSGAPSDASSDAAPQVPAAPGFAAYCRGKLLRALSLAEPTPGGWRITTRTAATGTEVLVANGGIWTPLQKIIRLEAFVIDTDGTPHQVTNDFTPLVAGADLEISCATDAQPTRVLLQTAHIYSDKAHAGAPCTLPASLPIPGIGTSYLGGPEGAHISGGPLAAYCGFQVGYSTDFADGDLLPK